MADPPAVTSAGPDGEVPLGPGRTLVRGTLLRSISTGLGFVLGVPVTLLLVRSLGVTRYGQFTYALSIVRVAGFVAEIGISQGVIRMASFHGDPEGRKWARSGLAIVVLTGAASGAVCSVISLLVDPGVRGALLILLPVPLALAMQAVLGGYLMTRGRITLVEGSAILYQILYNGLVIAFVVTHTISVPIAAVAQIFALYVSVLIMVRRWLVLSRLSGHRVMSAGFLKPLLAFSLPIAIANVAWVALQQSDVLLLGAFKGPHAVGLYSPTLKIVDASGVGLKILGSYFVVVTSPMVASGDYARVRFAYSAMAKWGIALIGPALTIIALGSRELLTLLFGSPFSSLGTVARVLALGYSVNLVCGLNSQTLTSLGRTKAIGIRSIVALAFNLAINIILIPSFGILGAAIGTSLVYVGLNVANSILIFRVARVHPFDRSYVITLVTWLLATGLAIAIRLQLHVTRPILLDVALAFAVALVSLMAALLTASPREKDALRINHFAPFLRKNAGGPSR